LTVLLADTSFDTAESGPSTNKPQQNNKIDQPSTSILTSEQLNTKPFDRNEEIEDRNEVSSQKQAVDSCNGQTDQSSNFSGALSSQGIFNSAQYATTLDHYSSHSGKHSASYGVSIPATESSRIGLLASNVSSPQSYTGEPSYQLPSHALLPPSSATIPVPRQYGSVLPPHAPVEPHRVLEPPLQISR
jgi:hypothetical protein